MIVFSILSFCIKLFILEFCYFFTFLYIWLFWEWIGKVGSRFFFYVFFYQTLVFLTRSFFWNFFLSRSHIADCEFIKLPWVYSSFLLRCYIFYFVFVFIFDIKLLGFKLYNFILFFYASSFGLISQVIFQLI